MRIVVSMTTIPSRLPLIGPTVTSLLQQSHTPDELYLALPQWSTKEQCRYPKTDLPIRIIHCDTDLRTFTKLLPCLQVETDPDTTIITVDDDKVYYRHMVRDLMRHRHQLPTAALALSGWIVSHGCRWYSVVSSPPWPVAVDFVQGTDAIAYHRGSLDYSGLLQYTRHNNVLDDIIVSAWLAHHGVKRVVVPGQRSPDSKAASVKALHGSLGFLLQNVRLVNRLQSMKPWVTAVVPSVVTPLCSFGFYVTLVVIAVCCVLFGVFNHRRCHKGNEAGSR